MNDCKDIPDRIISRLPRYYAQLKKLMEKDEQYISSEKLAELLGKSSSLVRRDLSHFGSFGKKSYGYDIEKLHQNISRIMGFDREKNMIIMGAGYLGRALANNDSYTERGYRILALFDTDPAIIGLEFNSIKVLDTELAHDFIRENNVEVAALAVPREEAQSVAEMVTDAGIKALWDFTETPLRLPDDIILIKQNMNEGLCRISCQLQ